MPQSLFKNILLIFALALAACSDRDAAMVEVDIDPQRRYQVVEGFGGFGAEKVWWDSEPFYTDEFVDLMINDLGLTILRDNLPIGFEPVNDNDDPLVIDYSGFNMSEDHPGADSHLGEHIPYLRAMHEAGMEKLVVSVWSPPIWMKHNDHRGNGSDTKERRTSAPPYTYTPDETSNQLRAELYEEFAEYCVAYIRVLKRETGIDLYAISLQNEPRFSQFYASAVYDPKSLVELVKVVGRRFERENIDTRIFMPEDVQSLDAVLSYINALVKDPEASRYTDIIATHNYRSDGIRPSDTSATNWRATLEVTKAHNKQLWMTETSGFEPNTIEGGMRLAKSIYNALKYGEVSAWIYWQMGGKDFIDKSGNKTYLYDVSKQFYRHIPPDSVRVAANSSHDDLLVVAFEKPNDNTQAMVLINNGDRELTVNLPELFFDSSAAVLTNAVYRYQAWSIGGGVVEVPPESILSIDN